MNDFRFANQEYLLLILILPIIALLLWFFYQKTNKKIALFFGYTKLNHLIDLKKNNHNLIATCCLFISFLLIIIALARPQANPISEKRENNGLDIIIALDVSKSMAAEDIRPSRLSKAKHWINTFLKKSSGDRIGLMAFAGSAVLISPLTLDYSIITNLLSSIDTNLIENQGTNISLAIERSLNAFERGAINNNTSLSKIILLLTDGEETDGAALTAIKKASQTGVLVHTVAIGTTKGAPIPLRNDRGVMNGYKKDKNNEVVISQVNADALMKVSQAGKGRFFFASQSESEIDTIISSTKNLQRSATSMINTKIYQEYFYIPASIALIFVLTAFLIKSPIFLSLSLFYFLIQKPEVLAASITDKLLKSENLIKNESAIQKYQNKKFSEAAKEFIELQVENPDSDALKYNIGTSLLEDGQLEKGLNSYKKIKDPLLKLKAKFNKAGAYSKKNMFNQAKATYAEIITDLSTVNRTAEEDEILQETIKNLNSIAKKNQQDQKKGKSQDKKSGENSKNSNKNNSEENNEKANNSSSDQQDSQNQDNKNSEDKTKPKTENAKDNNESEKQNKSQNQSKQINTAKNKSDQFKENKNLSRQSARQILRSLEQRENKIQKQFLRKKMKSNESPSLKDW